VFKTFEFPSFDTFLVQQQIPAINEAASMAGKSPEETINTLGGVLPGETSPEALQQFMGGSQGGGGTGY
jgi:hypothetical protein